MTNNLADDSPEVVNEGLQKLEAWHTEQMWRSATNVDPLWTIVREGGPLHTRAHLAPYCERLRATGRAHHAETLERLQGLPIDWGAGSIKPVPPAEVALRLKPVPKR